MFSPATPPYRIAGGPDVVSERLLAYELGYRIQVDPHLSLSLATFYNDYDDIRSVEPLPTDPLTVQVANGLRLISTLHVDRPDLILLDLNLPDMEGRDVLLRLKSDPLLARTPVIVLSADATPGQVRRMIAAGARAYLTKPLDVRQLLTHIDGALPAP